MINVADLRNKIITGISIKYVWDGSLHCALITLADSERNEHTLKIEGLLEFSVYDDFGTMSISQVKLLQIGTEFYLSLDPFDELSDVADYDKDNFWFLYSNAVVYD